MMIMSLSNDKPAWRVYTESRVERWGYVLRASVGPNGEGSSVAASVVSTFFLRASKRGMKWMSTDLAMVLRHVEAGKEPKAGRVVYVAIGDKVSAADLIAEAMARLPPGLSPAQRWLSGPNPGRSSAWLCARLTKARTALDDLIGGPAPAFPIDADAVRRCLSLLDEVPGTRASFDALRADVAGGEFKSWQNNVSFREWLPFLEAWEPIEAAVRRAVASGDEDDWKRADDVVKALVPSEGPSIQMEIDGATSSMTFAGFRALLKAPTMSDDEIRSAGADMAAKAGPDDPTYRVVE